MHHTYFNGIIQPSENTTLKINDLGLLRGYGLFDFFRTYNGKPFQWDLYWERFERSAQLLHIQNPIQKEEAYQVVLNLIEKSELADCAIRFVLTGGYAPNSVNADKPNLLISSENIHGVSASEYEQGIKVITYEYVRDLPEIKSTDYKHLMILQAAIKAANATDVLFHKNGFISELSRSNVFLFKNDVLITPNKDILHGITRHTVLQLAKPHFKIEERPVSFQELLEADEIFTTSTTKRVLPIAQIDEHKIVIGKKTHFLLDRFNELIENW